MVDGIDDDETYRRKFRLDGHEKVDLGHLANLYVANFQEAHHLIGAWVNRVGKYVWTWRLLRLC